MLFIRSIVQRMLYLKLRYLSGILNLAELYIRRFSTSLIDNITSILSNSAVNNYVLVTAQLECIYF